MKQIYFVAEVFCTVGYSLPAEVRDNAHYFVVSARCASTMPAKESPGWRLVKVRYMYILCY